MRNECAGTKDDHSDRCDLYDSEGYCRWYGETWLCEKDGKMHGGEAVERITYCTHRKIKGKRINDSMNPLLMERIPMWCEVVFDGQILPRHCDFYCPEGVKVFGDGRMYDPVSNRTILPDGTIKNGEYSEITKMVDELFKRMEEDGTFDKLRKKSEKNED